MTSKLSAEVTRAARSRTRASDVYERLRRDIVRCRLRPGKQLKFDATRRLYDVGLSPLREALMQLRAERLVTLADQRGFRVASVSKADMLDVMHLRQELDGMALRLSFEYGGTAWERGITESFEALQRTEGVQTKMRAPNQRWERHHRAFHQALGAACGSPWLMQLRELLYDQAERYRWLSFKYLTTSRDSSQEHRDIFTAVLRRDEAASIRLLREHLARTAEIVLQAGEEVFEKDAQIIEAAARRVTAFELAIGTKRTS